MEREQKELTKMDKLPWGIFAGSCAILWTFITVAIITVFVVSASMYAAVDSDDGLRESWWLIPLYVGEAVTVIGFAISFFFYVKREKKIEEM